MLFRISINLCRDVCKYLLKYESLLRGKAPEFEYRIDLNAKDHANLITLVVSIDQLTDADKLWKNAYDMAKEHINLFNPNYIARNFIPKNCIPQEEKCNECSRLCKFKGLVHIISKLHRMKFKMAIRWLYNSIMLQKYNDDSRNVPKGIPAKDLQDHIRKDRYKGYHWLGLGGDKLFSLWIRIETDYGYWKYDEKELSEVDIPVDIHIARVPFKIGALQLVKPKHSEISIGKIKPLIRLFWRLGGGTPLRYDELVWNLSKRFCSKCEGTSHLLNCPLDDLCQKISIRSSKGCYGTLSL